MPLYRGEFFDSEIIRPRNSFSIALLASSVILNEQRQCVQVIPVSVAATGGEIMTAFQAKILWGSLLVLSLGLGVFAAFTNEKNQQNKPSPKPETLLPENAVFYATWDGGDAHKQAYEKTAMHEALHQSGLSTAISNLLTYISAAIPGNSKESVDFLRSTFEKVSRKGVSLAVSLGENPQQKMTPYGIFVMHEAADQSNALKAIIGQYLGGEIAMVPQRVSGRKVTKLVPRGDSPPPFQMAFWNEGKHLVFVLGVNAITQTIAVADGKTTNVTTNPRFKKLRINRTNFEVDSLGWFDFKTLRKTFGKMPIPGFADSDSKPITIGALIKLIGFHTMDVYEFRSGYDGKACVSKSNLNMQGSRSGIFAVTGEPISLRDLPPLPPDTPSFGASSMNWSAYYDNLMKLVDGVVQLAPENERKKIRQQIENLPQVLGFDPKRDFFDALGNVSCFYVDPYQGFMGTGFGMAIQVRDPIKLRRSIGQMTEKLERFVAQMQQQRQQRGLGGLPDSMLNVSRKQKYNREMFVFEIMGGFLSPTLVVDNEWMIVGMTPQTAEAFLLRVDGKLDRWKPTAAHRESFGKLPKKFVSISVTDPRQTYRMLMQFGSFALPIVRMGMQFSGEMPPETAKLFSFADFPPSELVTKPLFPNVIVATSDETGFHWHSRSSMPAIPLLNSGGGSVAAVPVLIALLLPAVQQARAAARRAALKNNMTQLGIAMHSHHEAFNRLPQGTFPNKKLKPEKRLSWMYAVLPFIDQMNLYRQFDKKKAWDDKVNQKFAKTVIPAFLNPQLEDDSKTAYGKSHYVGMAGFGKDAASLTAKDAAKKNWKYRGVFGYDRKTRFRDITDGSSNTIGIIEVKKKIGPWAAGGNSTIRAATKKPYINGPDGFGGPNKGGVHVMLMDGSVIFLSGKISAKNFKRLCGMADGEILDGSDF